MCKILDPVDDDDCCTADTDLIPCSCGGPTPMRISASADAQGWLGKVVNSAVKFAGDHAFGVDVMMASAPPVAH